MLSAARTQTEPLSPERRIDLLRLMMLARRFDERLMDLFGQGLITGTAHAACGQEASADSTSGGGSMPVMSDASSTMP